MLSAFRELKGETSDNRYAVVFRGENIPIYTERSGARDLAQMQAALENVAPGHTLLIVAPYAAAFGELLTAKKNFVFMAPVSFTKEIRADERLVATDAALESFINRIDANDKFTIYLIPQWREARDYVAASVRELLERAAIRLKTIGHFGRLWQINFRLNAPRATRYADVADLKSLKPTALVMAGPSLDAELEGLASQGTIWCADTALPALAQRGILPAVVFSVDAGFASREHFVNCLPAVNSAVLVTDLLGHAAVQRLPFKAIITYASSHPLVQEFCAGKRTDLTPVENPAGDVGSLMRKVNAKLFGDRPVKILGHDGGHRCYVTHARGTAYFCRTFAATTRLWNAETYMLRLSRRYGKAAARSS